jgi:citrate lyase alpha subunit
VDFPLTMLPQSTEIDWSSYEKLWVEYADKASVESTGLSDGMTLMFEHSIIGKDSLV